MGPVNLSTDVVMFLVGPLPRYPKKIIEALTCRQLEDELLLISLHGLLKDCKKVIILKSLSKKSH
jgi:hypothetical protein